MILSKNTELIVKLLQIPGMGKKSVEIFIDKTIDMKINIDDDSDFISALKEYVYATKSKISIDNFPKALDDGYRIINNSNNNNISIVSKYDIYFPSKLRRIISIDNDKKKDVSPLILSYKGDISVLEEKKGIAIIGTRTPTDEGKEAGEYYGRAFAERGFNIISGLALGCDTAAHQGAITAKGITTAVLAHGLQTIYPKSNQDLADKILANNGLLISEYLYGIHALKNTFVERDRLQAGLAIATIVIQTGEKGGTMHAVKTTIDNRKFLAAVKYKDSNIMSAECVQGNTMLINNRKAFPLRKPEEFLEYIDKEGSVNYQNTINF